MQDASYNETPEELTRFPQPSSTNSNSFTSIADHFIASHPSIDHDEANDEDELRITTSTSTVRIPILELFNFNNEYWTDVFRVSSMRGLMEEMELHKLLDLDGEGLVDAEENDGDITRAHIDT